LSRQHASDRNAVPNPIVHSRHQCCRGRNRCSKLQQRCVPGGDYLILRILQDLQRRWDGVRDHLRLERRLHVDRLLQR
jgi:hypothetical protein